MNLRPPNLPNDLYAGLDDPFATALQSGMGGFQQGQERARAANMLQRKRAQVQQLQQMYPQLAGLIDETNVDAVAPHIAAQLLKTQEPSPPQASLFYDEQGKTFYPTKHANTIEYPTSPEEVVRTLREQESGGKKDFMFGEKEHQFALKRLAEFTQRTDPNRARGGELGKNQGRYNASVRYLKLYKQTGGNPDQRQMEEAAVSINNLLTQSSNGAQATINALVPRTMVGNAYKIAEWWTNNPTGTGQQKFARRLAETAVREGNVAKDMITEGQKPYFESYTDLANSLPDQYYAVMEKYRNMNPSLELPEFGDSGNAGWTPDKENRYQQLKQKFGK